MVIPSNRDISIKIQKRVPIQLRPPIFPFSGDSFFKVIDASNTPIAVIKEVKINTLRHPAIDAIVPPTAGPRIFPIPTNIRTRPTDLPRWCSPKLSTAIEKEVPWIIAPPIPCNNLPNNSVQKYGDIEHRNPPTVKMISPAIMTFFFPTISESLPMGKSNTATSSKYMTETHWTVGISVENRSDMFGRTIFTAPLSRAVASIEMALEVRAR